MTLPAYLQQKLEYFGIHSVADLKKHNYLQVFAWIRDKYPSTGYKILYDLYCIESDLPLNSLIDPGLVRGLYRKILPCYMPLDKITIKKYLDLAQIQAKLAYSSDEIPIGCVIVKDNQVIATGYNLTKTSHLVTAHAEIIALNQAAGYMGTMYLSKCDLYVTIEPCLMCSGAIINSRIKRVIFGAAETKTGAVSSQYQVFNNKAFNYHTQAIGPIDTPKYAALLRQFLQSKR